MSLPCGLLYESVELVIDSIQSPQATARLSVTMVPLLQICNSAVAFMGRYVGRYDKSPQIHVQVCFNIPDTFKWNPCYPEQNLGTLKDRISRAFVARKLYKAETISALDVSDL